MKNYKSEFFIVKLGLFSKTQLFLIFPSWCRNSIWWQTVLMWPCGKWKLILLILFGHDNGIRYAQILLYRTARHPCSQTYVVRHNETCKYKRTDNIMLADRSWGIEVCACWEKILKLRRRDHWVGNWWRGFSSGFYCFILSVSVSLYLSHPGLQSVGRSSVCVFVVSFFQYLVMALGTQKKKL